MSIMLRVGQAPRTRCPVVEFADADGQPCALEQSADQARACVWFGPDDARRMRLTRQQAAALLPYLREFVATGAIVAPTEEK